jgi:hypothetical protein
MDELSKSNGLKYAGHHVSSPRRSKPGCAWEMLGSEEIPLCQITLVDRRLAVLLRAVPWYSYLYPTLGPSLAVKFLNSGLYAATGCPLSPAGASPPSTKTTLDHNLA